MNKNTNPKQTKISKIETTNDVIASRGGLTFFQRYLENTRVYHLIEHQLGIIKGSRKGLGMREFLIQLMCFLMDGTNTSISYFDHLKSDEAHASLLEISPAQLASSHQIKRFFRLFMNKGIGSEEFREIISELFIWRLKLENPDHIILGIDTMVLDNNDARNREGVEPTYKRKKGFQPLHITWGPYLVDVIFRRGSAHSNHGDDFKESIKRIVRKIRSRYREDIPIILVGDSGFFDQKAFKYFEDDLKIHYVITGKFYDYLWDDIKSFSKEEYKEYKSKGVWSYLEFGFRYKSWDRFRRVAFTSLIAEENGQRVLNFMGTNSIIITNLGMDQELTDQLESAGIGHFTEIEEVIRINHKRGRDELVHRSLKEFITKEQLPFKHFAMNEAYYYFQVITHIMFESYKRDITSDIIAISSYPNTFRRKLIDFAVKIVSHGGIVKMRVREIMMRGLKLDELWERCQRPPVIQFL